MKTVCILLSFHSDHSGLFLDDILAEQDRIADRGVNVIVGHAEEFAALPPELQQALADEMHAVLEQTPVQEAEVPQEDTTAVSQEDLVASGNYVVVLGDYMNSITLYYENGVLVKIVESFQKNSMEEAEYAEYTGDALAEYSFNFIDWDNASLQDILNGMADYGNLGQYQIRSAD